MITSSLSLLRNCKWQEIMPTNADLKPPTTKTGPKTFCFSFLHFFFSDKMHEKSLSKWYSDLFSSYNTVVYTYYTLLIVLEDLALIHMSMFLIMYIAVVHQRLYCLFFPHYHSSHPFVVTSILVMTAASFLCILYPGKTRAMRRKSHLLNAPPRHTLLSKNRPHALATSRKHRVRNMPWGYTPLCSQLPTP